MDIEKDFLRYLNNNRKTNAKQDEDMFVTCPKIFYHGLSEDEIRSMQQLYRIAYEKARAKTQNEHNEFYNGDGI